LPGKFNALVVLRATAALTKIPASGAANSPFRRTAAIPALNAAMRPPAAGRRDIEGRRRVFRLYCRVVRRAVLAAAAGAMLQSAALADDAAPLWPWLSPDEALRQLTDPGGLRTRLEQAGVQFNLNYFGGAFWNPVGGIKQGQGYDGRFAAIMDADLDKLVGWSGATFHVSLHQIHGTQFGATDLQSLAEVSGVEAPPSTRLFNLWIEQKIGSQTTLRVGQFTAAQEFLVSDVANLFVNATFGWPVLPSQNLPSGGPNWPEGALGARVEWSPTKALTLRAAVFNGDAAGPGTSDPVLRDPDGLAFRINDPPFVIAELEYDYNRGHRLEEDNPNQEARALPAPQPTVPARSTGGLAGGLPGTIKIGGWYHAGEFADPRFDNQSGLLAVTGGTPLQHAGDFSVYGVIDQMLWRGGVHELDGFVRAMASPDDRNLISFYLDGGFALQGVFDSRPDDILGLGIAYARVSPQAAASDRDVAAITGTPIPIRDYEATIELTYLIQLARNWSMQPNLQYIIHPDGNVVDPNIPVGVTPIPNAFVLGLRTHLKF
jgi:porin